MNPDSDAAAIEAEIGWFSRLLDRRFRIHGGEIEEADLLADEPPPDLSEDRSGYAGAVRAAGLGPGERLVLILAALPHLRPQALDPLLIQNASLGRPFTEFGGVAGTHNGFRPTRETALFLLAGESMARRLAAIRLFAAGAPLHRLRILAEPAEPGAEGPWAPLALSPEWLARLTGAGGTDALQPGPGFPAQRLETAYGWDDLVLPDEVREAIDDMRAWARHSELMMNGWGLKRHLKPGYRALFHGPPGTGKTATAAVLGNSLGLAVFRVDLSRVVSKYIGETEKNLASMFDRAEASGAILFFDEADALFGKRSEVKDSHDRYANQQIAYLLQRIEDYPGVAILATNLNANIDPAFARRFQASVYFAMPDAAARLELWRRLLAPPLPVEIEPSALAALAAEHEIAGGGMVNVLRHAAARAAEGAREVRLEDLRKGIALERGKEGRLGA